MQPRPWSNSALDCHTNCPEQYNHKYVLRDLPPEEKSKEQTWGIEVHKHFETYLTTPPAGSNRWDPSKSGYELPHDLKTHEPYLQHLMEKAAEGSLTAERKVALRRQPFGPCGYFDKDVWWRGVLDCTIVEPDNSRATIADWKTGKKHEKWDQLAIYAVYIFFENPQINLINAQFYWTQDPDPDPMKRFTKKVWGRSEIDSLIGMYADNLRAYVQSFKTETFVKKQSGLCRGWCPVKTCPFWEPKKEYRR